MNPDAQDRRWLRGENTIPAWALITAAQVCDRDLSSLLAEAGTVLPDRAFVERMEEQERHVADLGRQLPVTGLYRRARDTNIPSPSRCQAYP